MSPPACRQRRASAASRPRRTNIGARTSVLLVCIGAQLALAMGVREGRLTPCPDRPNCVSSQASGRNHVAPLPFSGSVSATMAQLKRVLASLPRTRVVEETDVYLHAEATSRILRFVDDVELYIDESSRLVHVRSASRVGYSDFGVNRARIEAIRARFSTGAESSRDD